MRGKEKITIEGFQQFWRERLALSENPEQNLKKYIEQNVDFEVVAKVFGVTITAAKRWYRETYAHRFFPHISHVDRDLIACMIKIRMKANEPLDRQFRDELFEMLHETYHPITFNTAYIGIRDRCRKKLQEEQGRDPNSANGSDAWSLDFAATSSQ